MESALDELIDDYLDGRLSGTSLRDFEARLAEPALRLRLSQRQALHGLVAESLPQLSAADSKRLWVGIQARIAAAPAPVAVQPWYAFLTKQWMPVWGIGAAAALAVVLVLKPWSGPVPQPIQQAQPPQVEVPVALAAKAVVAPSAVARSVKKTKAVEMASAPAAEPKPKAMLARLVAVSKAANGPTEVERALAESDTQVDDMIEAFLKKGPVPIQPTFASRVPSMGGVNSSLVALRQDSADSMVAMAPSAAVRGQRDRNGFWDWKAAAMALNTQDWGQAQAELTAAASQAGEASERAFANSALTLLSGPGAPLEGSQPSLAASGDLRVLGAGRWQLQMDQRLARFSQGISVRLPGFRVEGDSLVLDLTFDRGTFAAGTHFVRVAGETPARVYNAAYQTVEDNEFTATQGAVYNVQERELRLR